MSFWNKGIGKVMKNVAFRGIDTIIPGGGMIAESISDKVFTKGSGFELDDLFGGPKGPTGPQPSEWPLDVWQKQVSAQVKAGMPVSAIAKMFQTTETFVKNVIKGLGKTEKPTGAQLRTAGINEEEVKQSILEKASGFIKENMVAVASTAGTGVLFLIIRLWQMTKPKSKRWSMFK